MLSMGSIIQIPLIPKYEMMILMNYPPFLALEQQIKEVDQHFQNEQDESYSEVAKKSTDTNGD